MALSSSMSGLSSERLARSSPKPELARHGKNDRPTDILPPAPDPVAQFERGQTMEVPSSLSRLGKPGKPGNP